MTTRKALATAPSIDLSNFYQPHLVQWKVHQSDAKFKILVMARRIGKSRMALFELLKTFIESLSIPVSSARVPPFHAWIICPSFPQARQTWHELMSLIPGDMVIPGGFHQEEQTIELKGNENRSWGLIEMKSAHNYESLQTVGLDFAWFNEAQEIPDAAFERTLPVLRSPEAMGRLLAEGIPPLTSDHWFYRLHRLALAGTEGYFTLPPEECTVYHNPMLTQEQLQEVENDRELLREASWRRMYLAEFRTDAGFFRNVDECIGGDILPEAVPGVRYVAGLDLGRKLDATVMTIMDARERKVIHQKVFDQAVGWPVVRETIAHFCGAWGIQRLVVDATSTGGDIFVQELEATMRIPVEPYQFNMASREHLLNQLAIAMERRTISYPPLSSLLRQLRNIQMRKMSNGRMRPDPGLGEHDDEVMSLALALEGCDAEAPLTVYAGINRRRYLPTQAETDSGVNLGRGAQLMKERATQRMKERMERLGV